MTQLLKEHDQDYSAVTHIQWISALVPIVIIVGFFFLQIQIDMTDAGWAEKALLMLSVLVEIALIGWWEGGF